MDSNDKKKRINEKLKGQSLMFIQHLKVSIRIHYILQLNGYCAMKSIILASRMQFT